MNIAKTGAAFGLAALTLASSLSIGEMANAASAKDPKAKSSKVATPNATMRGKLITPLGDGRYHYIIGGYSSVTAQKVGTLSDAVREAATLTLPAKGSTGSIPTADGLCLGVDNFSTDGPTTSPYLRANERCNLTEALFGWDGQGNLTNAAWSGYRMSHWGTPSSGGSTVMNWTRTGTLKPAPEYLEDYVPPVVSTTQGVYNMTSVPDQGSTFATGTTGKVSFVSQPTTGATVLPLKANEKYSWTVTLPAGLEVDNLPADRADSSWKREYSRGTAGGKNTVTLTMTRLGSTDSAVSRHAVEFPVVAKAGLANNAQVSATFSPPAGYSSSSSTSTSNVRVDTTQSTTMGVYNHYAEPDAEGKYRPGRTGKVKFDSQPTANATPVKLRVNESITWTTTLPVGLKPIDLPKSSSNTYWRHVWSETTTAGATTVTHTVTRLSGEDNSVANWDNEFKVVGEAGLADNARVSTSVTLPAGYASASPNGSSTVKSAETFTATLGIHDHSVKPDQGTVFSPGTVGHVDMKSNASSDATGVWMTTGETLTYTTVLPSGLRPGTLPAASSGGGFNHTWASSTENGVTSVTHTITRTGAGLNVTERNFANRFEVVAEANLTDGAAVTTTFTPPAGFASSNVSRTSTVQVDTTQNTTLGVHNHTVTPVGGTTFKPGTKGHVNFDPQPAANRTKITIPGNGSISWATTLPTGLKPGTLPEDNATATWRHTYTATTTGGVATVTHTMTNLTANAIDVTNPGDNNRFEVEAEATLTDGATVSTTFTPPAGFISSSATGSSTVRFESQEVVTPEPIVVNSGQQAGTYTPGTNTLSGTATEGATISAKNVGPNGNWNVGMGTATVKDGAWSLPARNWGPTNTYYVVVTQTRADGSTTEERFTSAPAITNQPIAVTSGQQDGTYTPGTNTLSGTATEGATITAKNVGPNGNWNVGMGTATVKDGAWSLPARNWGPTNTYYVVVTQTRADGSTTEERFTSAPIVTNVPVAVTSIADQETYRPGQNVLKGTGTKGATIKVTDVGPQGTWDNDLGSATVDDKTGAWQVPARNWGPSNDYYIKVTQTNPDKTTSEELLTVLAPRFQPLVMTSPAVGDMYENGVAAHFEGTTTPFATVTVRSAQTSAVYKTVEADKNGVWKFDRRWGTDHRYVLIVESVAPAGDDEITDFTWTTASATD
ncbi:hypothetical protein [Frondihabitans cladoniiphilus]|uniref:Bacterial Ig domain-containing protein n=1 Tax=Frondihabitans cladoniiphilus TaxID=715785 RepID=A0ABP8W4Z4_9MICO